MAGLQATLQHFGAALRGHVAAATGAAAAGLAAAGVEVGLPQARLISWVHWLIASTNYNACGGGHWRRRGAAGSIRRGGRPASGKYC